MKKLITPAALAMVIALVGCSSDAVHANNNRALKSSVDNIKRRLPKEQFIEFETALWSLKGPGPIDDQFRDTVDGKTPYEIIEMAKENFKQKKAAGDQNFAQYESWQAMVEEIIESRKNE